MKQVSGGRERWSVMNGRLDNVKDRYGRRKQREEGKQEEEAAVMHLIKVLV